MVSAFRSSFSPARAFAGVVVTASTVTTNKPHRRRLDLRVGWQRECELLTSGQCWEWLSKAAHKAQTGQQLQERRPLIVSSTRVPARLCARLVGSWQSKDCDDAYKGGGRHEPGGLVGIAGGADEPGDDQLRRAPEQGSACCVGNRKPAGPHRWQKLGHGSECRGAMTARLLPASRASPASSGAGRGRPARAVLTARTARASPRRSYTLSSSRERMRPMVPAASAASPWLASCQLP
jgi:hypothetical protein